MLSDQLEDLDSSMSNFLTCCEMCVINAAHEEEETVAFSSKLLAGAGDCHGNPNERKPPYRKLLSLLYLVQVLNANVMVGG